MRPGFPHEPEDLRGVCVRHGLQTPAADLKTTFLTPSSPPESWGTTRSIWRTAPGSPLPYVSERGTLAKESPSFRDGPYFERATLQERLPPDQRLSPESLVQSVVAPTEPPPRDVLPISAHLPRLHRMQYRSLPLFLQRYPLQSQKASRNRNSESCAVGNWSSGN